jgi:3-oxoacyl-[acyl-carrier protein] reductase
LSYRLNEQWNLYSSYTNNDSRYVGDAPGFIAGEWLREGFGDEKYELLMENNRNAAPLGVVATPETVADAILHFISGSQVITGETLIVDGGRHLSMAPLSHR